jgi:hypothetical protein
MKERFIDNGDGTILDTSTGLTWQKDTQDMSFTFKKAAEYARNLDLSGKGWRVPTRAELIGIVDDEKLNPCISKVFGKTFSEWYWSSTLFQGGSSDAWFVDFFSGFSYGNGVAGSSRVRCVR